MPEEQTEDDRHIVVLFDENMPHIKACRRPKDCNNPKYLCRHRLNFNSHIFYISKTERRELHEAGLEDLGVVNLFLTKILKNNLCWPEVSIDNQVFVIVTKDSKFIRSARGHWIDLKKDSALKHDLEFGDGFISNHDITIFIQKIECKQYGNDKGDNLKCMIEKLNRRWGRNMLTTSR
ncbi:MAG: hypothetical protein Q8Q06_02775 [bacterium]|nr:hypothetical protein [bacterium]